MFEIGDLLEVTVERTGKYDITRILPYLPQQNQTLTSYPTKRSLCIVLKKRPVKLQILGTEKEVVYTLFVQSWSKICDFQTFDLRDAIKVA